ncbi:NAD(P)-dependent oxidoreductase [Phenylobacterium sp.]|uniref:NAD(P)-dependent oxidoreductase n=1 Tax=Phenylobacterium sp. TaxID=1871053 RepID=UPI002B94556D|nr:NAD(P)-binding domain-containing protein [Phenylobacterium sp.]HVI33607.1 NAD(P)-binding domain-containing protein [Phenylobacterium sp.]
MVSVGVIGTGLMGSAIARQLLVLGHRVVVWNRTPSRCQPLQAVGASVAETPTDLARAVEVVIALTATTPEVELMIRDGMPLHGRDFINLVTATPSQVRTLRRQVADAGGRFLSGTIQAYPSGIGSSEATVVYGGELQVWEDRKDLLRGLAGSSFAVGEDPGRPNVLDASVTGTFLFTAAAACLEAARYATKDGLSLAEFREHLQGHLAYLPTMIDNALSAVEQNDFASTEAVLEIYARSLELYRDAFADVGASDHLLTANLDRMRAAIAAGDGNQGFSALFRH